MTSRRKDRKSPKEDSEVTMPRKRETAVADASATPPDSPQKGRRRRQAKDSPPSSEEAPPRKSRRVAAAAEPPPQKQTRRAASTPESAQKQTKKGTSTPESAQKSTRRGTPTPKSAQKQTPQRESRSSTRSSRTPTTPVANTSPRGRGRRSRRGSTDSSASSIGNTSATSISTPTTRRSRAGSNSSEASCLSEITTASATSSRGGRKRPKADSPPVPTSKTNGASPQLSQSRTSKRRKVSGVNEVSPTVNDVSPSNGRSGRKRRGRAAASETPPPGDLDGGTENSTKTPSATDELDNSEVLDEVTEIVKSENKNCLSSDVNGDKADSGSEENGEIKKQNGDEDHSCQKSVSDDVKDAQKETTLKDEIEIINGEKDKKGIKQGVGKSSGTKCKEKDNEIQDESKTLIADISSHTESTKRKLFDGETSDHIESDTNAVPPLQKKMRGDARPVVDDNTSVILDKASQGSTCGGKAELKDVPTEMDSEVPVTVAGTYLDKLNLTDEQKMEILSSLSSEVKDSSVNEIVETLVEQVLSGVTTAKTMNAPRFNKFLRQLLAQYCSLETTRQNKHALCEKAVAWARERKSVNLRHELELTLMTLYNATKHYKKAETIANALYSETKKLQDKEKTVKACLCLSQVYHAMGNISKARASITTAKTEALKIYTPPDMQGELDLQSGIMQVAEGKDLETAFSYFKEAATGFTTRKLRARALKYMLLSKVMVNRSEEGEKAVKSQSHVQDIDEGVEAMLAITSAANKSSLADFKKTRAQYKDYLEGDMVVASVLDDLYTSMMEKNLLNIVLPYERLQIAYIAEKIGLPREEVERRLSQMILDKRINAQLDHRDDCLYVYGSEEKDIVYQNGITSLTQLDKTISHLNRKVKKLL